MMILGHRIFSNFCYYLPHFVSLFSFLALKPLMSPLSQYCSVIFQHNRYSFNLLFWSVHFAMFLSLLSFPQVCCFFIFYISFISCLQFLFLVFVCCVQVRYKYYSTIGLMLVTKNTKCRCKKIGSILVAKHTKLLHTKHLIGCQC